MNNGAFGENFPYSNFHDLNLDWIVKIVKEFKDNQTDIEQSITDVTDESIERANTEITEIVNNLIATIPPDYTTLENNALQSSGIIVTSSNIDTYKELNNLQVQRIYLYGREAYLTGELLHYPSRFTFGAQIITLNYQNPAIAGEVQLAFSMSGDGFAYRVNNGVQWTDWLYSVNETAVQPSGIIYFDNNVSGHTDIALEPQCKIITYTRSAVLSGLQHAPSRFTQGFTFVKMPYMFGNNTGEMFIAVDLASGAIASKTITTGTDTPYVYSNPYYTVGATGCDFTTVRACLEYIARFKIEHATVFITDGIYNLVDEYADILENTVVNGTGLPIGGSTHIIMGEHSEIRFLYEGNREDIGNNFAVFNIYGSCTFEHIKVNCKNCKYVVHDDVPVMISKGVITELPKDLIVKYIDCTFRHLGNPNVSYSTPVCIGGGTIPGAMYIIDGGSYGTANANFPYPISYHNHYKAQLGNFGARVVIRNTWLPTGQAIRFGTYGDSQIVGSIDGCKLGASTNYGSPASYFPIEEWNNTIR